MLDLASRLAQLRHSISAAADRAHRSGSEIELIAVSKTHPVEAVQEAIRAGLVCFGENKVQEAKAKIDFIGRGIWHLIGHLQANKVKEAVRLFDSIDSIDRLELAQEINDRADILGKTQNVLLQVNVARESAKFGCTPEESRSLAEAINELPRLALNGLMTIAPYTPEPEKSRVHFAALRELRDKIQQDTGLRLPVLSMGMSTDFEVAIEEGSTSVRIGTILFGERLKMKNRRPEDPSFTEST